MSFWQNFPKSSIFDSKTVIFSGIVVGTQQNFTKVPQNSPLRPHSALLFLKFQKKMSNFTSFIQLGEVSGEILLKSTQVLLIIHHDMGKVVVLLCMYVTFQG